MIFLINTLVDEHKQLVKTLYQDLKPMMGKIAFNYLQNKEEAEEAVSNAFIKIIDNIEKISKFSCPEMYSYCVSILKNESINILRKKKHTISTDEIHQLEDGFSLEEKVFENIEIQNLMDIIDTLKEEEKQLLYFRFVEELSFKNIGEILNISENTANKRIQRLIAKLKSNYKTGDKIGK